MSESGRPPAGHLVLLGDSIFDNQAYTGSDPSVSEHLRGLSARRWGVSLCAVDGAVIRDVPRQLCRLPPTATHLVLSAGGNDALKQRGFLNEPARSVAEALSRLAALARDFREDYEALLDELLALGKPLAVCTVYESNYRDPRLKEIADTALTAFDDAILRSAFRRGLPVIELRLVCTGPADYANDIEPSGAGGAKIAATIMELLETHDFACGRSAVYRWKG